MVPGTVVSPVRAGARARDGCADLATGAAWRAAEIGGTRGVV